MISTIIKGNGKTIEKNVGVIFTLTDLLLVHMMKLCLFACAYVLYVYVYIHTYVRVVKTPILLASQLNVLLV